MLKRFQEGLNKTGPNWHFGAETDLFNFRCNFLLSRPEGHYRIIGNFKGHNLELSTKFTYTHVP